MQVHHRLALTDSYSTACTPVDGSLRPDGTRPGLGLELRKTDAERYRVAR